MSATASPVGAVDHRDAVGARPERPAPTAASPSPPCMPRTANGSPCVPRDDRFDRRVVGLPGRPLRLPASGFGLAGAHGSTSVFGRHRQQAVDRQPQPGRTPDGLVGDLVGDPVDEEQIEKPAARRLVLGHDAGVDGDAASRRQGNRGWRHRARPAPARAPAAWCRRAPRCGGSPSGRHNRRSAACWRYRAAATPCGGARRWRDATRPRNR